MITITTCPNRGTVPAADAIPEGSSPAAAASQAAAAIRTGTLGVLLDMRASCAVASSQPRENKITLTMHTERRATPAQAPHTIPRGQLRNTRPAPPHRTPALPT